MASVQLTPGSLIRTPQHTCLVKQTGELRCLRDGDKTWSKKKVVQEMVEWSNLDVFLTETQPLWWSIELRHPVNYFAQESREYMERTKSLPAYTYLAAKDMIRNDIFGRGRTRFYNEFIQPLVTRYDLKKATDMHPNDLIYGTTNSPVGRLAEEQMLESEPDRTKWQEKASHDKHFWSLYKRYLLTPAAVERVKAMMKAGERASSSLQKAAISRDTLDLLLASGAKKVTDELWVQLTRS